MVPIIASHRRRLLQFLVVPLLPHLHEFLSISRTEHVLKHCSIAKCTNFPFQRVLIRPKLIPDKRVMSISSQRCNLSRRISERATSNVLAISPCTGLEIHWSWMRWNGNLMELLNINFLLLVQLWTCSQIDENSCILLGFRRCWRSWLKFFWSWTHGSASSCLQNILNTLPPGWRSGVETNANKPTIPKISICGKVSLAKLVSVRVC